FWVYISPDLRFPIRPPGPFPPTSIPPPEHCSSFQMADEKVDHHSHGSNNRSDLNERRRVALSEIDNAKFSCASFLRPYLFFFFSILSLQYSFFYIKIVMVAGVGFFTDA